MMLPVKETNPCRAKEECVGQSSCRQNGSNAVLHLSNGEVACSGSWGQSGIIKIEAVPRFAKRTDLRGDEIHDDFSFPLCLRAVADLVIGDLVKGA